MLDLCDAPSESRNPVFTGPAAASINFVVRECVVAFGADTRCRRPKRKMKPYLMEAGFRLLIFH